MRTPISPHHRPQSSNVILLGSTLELITLQPHAEYLKLACSANEKSELRPFRSVSRIQEIYPTARIIRIQSILRPTVAEIVPCLPERPKLRLTATTITDGTHARIDASQHATTVQSVHYLITVAAASEQLGFAGFQQALGTVTSESVGDAAVIPSATALTTSDKCDAAPWFASAGAHVICNTFPAVCSTYASESMGHSLLILLSSSAFAIF